MKPSETKINIAKNIKSISINHAINDFIKLQNIDLEKTSSLARTGLKFIDYFTYVNRLDTVGSKGISFFTFVEDWDIYRQWPCIKRLYDKLCPKHPDNFYKVAKEVFQLYFGSINAYRPIVAMKIYDRYKPKHILNVCSGWSGFVVAGAAMNIHKITAIDNNFNLTTPYNEMKLKLEKYSSTEINFIMEDALNIDYSKIEYDMAICSPPYYDKEIYNYLPAPYNTKYEWNICFYRPLFSKLWENLQINGTLVINIPIEIYVNVLMPLLGEADEKILLPKYGRNNSYKEYNYVYFKK